MAGPRRSARGAQREAAQQTRTQTPRDIYAEMLAEAGVSTSARSELPLKRRRHAGGPSDVEPANDAAAGGRGEASDSREPRLSAEDDEDEEEGIEFEDVEIPRPTIQTVVMDSDDEESDDDDEGVLFEDVDLSAVPMADDIPPDGPQPEDKTIELNLSTQRASMAPASRRRGPQRKPLTREERARRLEVHKMHLLCLLFHSAMRNRWCNDEEVQECLRPLLSQQMINYLNPSRKLSQFGRAEALKKGLVEVGNMFWVKFAVTERGLRRALWAEDAEHLSMVSCLYFFHRARPYS
jgi:xeroderma pigmentosum group C-complementing protein